MSEMKRSFLEIVRSKTTALVLSQVVVALVTEITLGSFLQTEEFMHRVGRGFVTFLLLLVLQRISISALSGYRVRDIRSYLWLHFILVSSILFVAGCRVLALGMVSYAENHSILAGLSESALAFAMPVTTASLIVQSIFGLHCGFVVALLTAILLSSYSATPVATLSLTLATCVIGVLSLNRVRSRSAYLKAALNITLCALPFALEMILTNGIQSPVDGMAAIAGCILAAAGSAFVAVGITPIIEYFSGYASDMRLIEMATLDHPLLKELSIQAPGTWNHSMVMGMMVESAADAINANPTVCRVGAYFHDVGKTKKPLYFVENQAPGENRHDKLSSPMSALIIRAHVKDGMELARKHKLPEVIVQMIPQHHGTSVIEYFYEKAKKEHADSSDSAENVDVSLYSYPGPKPQTREAGLLMLADGIEAAARTVSDPTSDRIQGLVQKMINKVFASGQLNECELTLRDLHQIAKSFTRVLTGIYHQRIAYAEPVEKTESEKNSNEKNHGTKKNESQEDLKRLGVE